MIESWLRSVGLPVGLSVVLAAVAFAGSVAARTSAASAGSVAWPEREFVVYMAPPELGGSDSNSGLTYTRPVATLHRVHEVLSIHRPRSDVEVRIQPGRYVSEPMDAWRFYVPGHTVSFLPQDYAYGEGADGIESRPVFRNATCGDHYCDGAWLTMRPPVEESDPMYGGGDSGLRFYYLTIERYSGAAISILGDSERTTTDPDRNPPLRIRGGKGLDGNAFVGLHIRQIGNRWSGGHYGWGGIVLTNSSNNTIVHNRFTDIENVGKYAGYIHGLYITHFSSDNLARGNRFDSISGDPVKVRNRSNRNLIMENVFANTGQLSYYRGEFCGAECARQYDIPQQCPSYGNEFVRNRLRGGYRGNEVEVWTTGSGSYPYSRKSACTTPAGQRPLRTAGNDRG